MMAEKQVVIVKEAQQLKDIQRFENYVKSPQASTILVFCHKYKKIDGRKSVGKILKKTSVMFTSNKLRDYELPDWIKKIVSANKMVINPKNTLLLAEYLGADLAKIEGQIEKLKVVLPAGSEITTEVIEKNIGISKEYNIFELQSALAKKDILKAVKITNYFAKNPKSNPMVMTISGLYSYFSKVLGVHVSSNKGNDNAVAKEIGVHPFFVKEYNLATRNYSPGKLVKIIGYLRDYDLKSKGVNNNATYTPHSELMKELMFKIMH
jgi:DNA polymerase-3 subunit delta